MSDSFLIALATVLAAALAVGVPATITSLSTKRLAEQARQHAEIAAREASAARALADTAASTLGVKNGNGDAMTMLERGLKENAALAEQNRQIIAWQNAHSDVEHRLVELAKYSHDSVHDLKNKLTPFKAQIDVLWKHAGFPPLEED